MLVAIREQIRKCRESLSVIGDGTVSSNMMIGPRTKKFLSEMESLISILPTSEQMLINAVECQIKILKSQTTINPFAFGQLQAFLKSLAIRYDNVDAKQIFISHSSNDKELVKAFVEKILRLGIGISANDIFCTSIETMGIKNGDDMRSHIRQNLLGCDLAILMISCSYIKSSICLNEMGAIWGTPIPNVNVFVCPDSKLPDSIGWLYEVKKADMLFSKEALDRFYEMVTTTYGKEQKVTEWGIQRDAFLALKNRNSSKLTLGKVIQKCNAWR